MRTLRPAPIYTPSRSVWRKLYHLTDVHLGHAACNEKLFRQDVERIANDPLAMWGGGGDYIDAIIHKDPRWRASSVARWLAGKTDIITRQVERFCEMVSPIADKCLYLTKGNHEDMLLKYHDRDAYREIVRRIADMKHCDMRTLALGWEGFIVLTFRRGTRDSYGGTRRLTIYTHHGAGGGRRKGASGLRAEEIMWTYEADLYLLGHRHNRDAYTKQIIKPSGRGVAYHNRVAVWCGSYLDPYNPDSDDIPRDSYQQSMQLLPITAGTVPILIKPDVPLATPVLANGPVGAIMEAI